MGAGGLKRTDRVLGILAQAVEDGHTLATTRFCVAELYVGIELSVDRTRESGRVSEVLAGLDILEFGEDAARIYGYIQATLRRAGRPAGDMDTLIAATAIANGMPVMTRNAKHFDSMPGLVVVSYA